MNALAPPSPELAARIVREVDFGERFIACRIHQRHGYMPVNLYSFREAVDLLRGANPYVDLQRFSDWVRAVMDDGELADRIDEIIAVRADDRVSIRHIGELADQRLRQCTEPGSCRGSLI